MGIIRHYSFPMCTRPCDSRLLLKSDTTTHGARTKAMQTFQGGVNFTPYKVKYIPSNVKIH